MATYRLFPSASGPTNAVSYALDLISGVVFTVTQGGMWFEGYWWWVCPGSPAGSTLPQKFALWCVSSNSAGGQVLIPGTVVMSGTLSTGWNYIPLPAAVPLAPGGSAPGSAMYVACTGVNANFPTTTGYWTTAGAGAGGVTNGPLTAYSDQSPGTLPALDSIVQGPYATAGTDPAADCPVSGTGSQNLWIDVQVSDTAPGGYSGSYQVFPNLPVLFTAVSAQAGPYTLGMEFSLSAECYLTGIWHFSMPGSAVLPARCGIWNVGTQTEVAGTDNASPSWLLPAYSGGGPASAGDGWVYCDYSSSGVTLAASTNYKVSTFYGSSGEGWFLAITDYWDTGPGAAGVTSGVITAPNAAGASPSQNSYNSGATWTYPDSSANPENDWVDVQVTVVPPPVVPMLYVMRTFP